MIERTTHISVYIWLKHGALLCRGEQIDIPRDGYGGYADDIIIGNCAIVNSDNTNSTVTPYSGLFRKKKTEVFQTIDEAITRERMNNATLCTQYDAEIDNKSDLIRFILRHNCTGKSYNPIARKIAIEYAVYFTRSPEKEFSV